MAPNWLEGQGKQRTSGQGAWESLKKLQDVNGGTRSTETLDMKFFVVIALAGFMPLMLFISSVSNIFCESKHSILFPCLLVLNSTAGVAKQQERLWGYDIILHKCLRTLQCPLTKWTPDHWLSPPLIFNFKTIIIYPRSLRSSGVHGRNKHRREAYQRIQLLLRLHGGHKVKCHHHHHHHHLVSSGRR